VKESGIEGKSVKLKRREQNQKEKRESTGKSRVGKIENMEK
jgi:hypothetical protein